MKLSTLCAKTYTDQLKLNRPLSETIQPATTFQAESSDVHAALFNTESPLFYQRFGHPNTLAVEEKLAKLENTEAALVFSSGMGAISTALLSFLSKGDHVVAQREIFAQTFTFLNHLSTEFDIQVDFVPKADPEGIRQKIRNNTKIIYIETPSNPLIHISDIEAIAKIAKKHRCMLLVDSTFASPVLQNPIHHGASIVLHSGTKFLGGHSDVMCGVVAGKNEFIYKIRAIQKLVGNVLDPRASWLLLRGLRTLALRVEKQSENALAIAQFLASSKKVNKVNYPFLADNEYQQLAKKQMKGGGGVISFEVAGGIKKAKKLADSLSLIPIATSLGGVETVIEIPFALDWNEKELGDDAHSSDISPSLLRLSVGIEDANDLIDDLSQSLDAIDE